jgi:hypothetical protein
MLGKVRFEAVSSKLVDAKGAREEAAAVMDLFRLNKPSIAECRSMKLHSPMSYPNMIAAKPTIGSYHRSYVNVRHLSGPRKAKRFRQQPMVAIASQTTSKA